MRWPKPSSTDDVSQADAFFVAWDAEQGCFELHGELDVDTAPVLDDLPVLPGPGGGSVPPGADEVVVFDLSELAFVDSSGLRALLEIRRKVIDLGAHLVLRNARANVRRVLSVTGLDSVFTVEDAED